MAKYRAHIAFVVIMAVYFLIRFLRSTFTELPDFIRFHFTDFLFVPAMCLFALIILRFIRKDPHFTIHWFSVAIQTILVCFYFEWYLPSHTPKGHLHVSDLIDCIMYSLGGIVFVLIQPYLSVKRTGPRKVLSHIENPLD